jgi:hypothetical protein
VTGHSALALVALVAANSPTVTKADKKVMAALFQGRSSISYPVGKTISVRADQITCVAGDIQINFYSCDFTFGKKTVPLSGRLAHEMFATMAGLLGALAHHGLDNIGAVEKDEMRDLIMRGGPWTDDERTAILDYCESDVAALARLLPKMMPNIDLPRALLRGRYMAAVGAFGR